VEGSPPLSRRSKYILALLMIIAVVAGYIGYLYRSAGSLGVSNPTLEEFNVKGLRVEMKIGLDIYNPAIQGLRADKISYDVYLEDTYIGSGEARHVYLPPRKITHVVLPLNASLTSLGAKLMPLLLKASARGEINLKIKGIVTLGIKLSGMSLGSLRVPYTVSRTVRLAGGSKP
jgi:LEA14-like dessication related protein